MTINQALLKAVGAFKSGDVAVAKILLSKIIQIEPNQPDANSNMGSLLVASGDLEEALPFIKTALEANFSVGQYWFNYIDVLFKLDRFSEALELLAVARDKGCKGQAFDELEEKLSSTAIKFEIQIERLLKLIDQGEIAKVLEVSEPLLREVPDSLSLLNVVSLANEKSGNFNAAVENYKQASEIVPNSPEIYYNIGNNFREQGKLEEAIEAYKKALAIKPDYVEAHVNLSFALLNSGRLREGLDENEWRWKTAVGLSHKRHFSQPMWDGQKSLRDKKILIWCEQGVGDTILWSSCLSLISTQVQHCILECPKKLVSLLGRSFPNVEVKPENKSSDQDRDDFDFYLPMGSLYRHFISEISQNTKADAFLVPDPVRVDFWRQRLSCIGKGPYVGISWKSSNMSTARLPNYAHISEFSPILILSDVTFVNLQYIDFANDLTKIQNELGVTIHNFDDLDHYNDLDDVAALSAALDIVVSIQSAVPLISAGVGTLTKLACWRQSIWNNILYEPVGPVVDKFIRNTWEPWDNVFSLIAKDIIDLTDN